MQHSPRVPDRRAFLRYRAMDDCTGREGDGRFRWRSALDRECSGDGPNTIPYPRQLRLTSDAVDLRSLSDHAAAVSQLLESLNEDAIDDRASAPDLAWLRLPHPCNTREHAAQLCEYGDFTLSSPRLMCRPGSCFKVAVPTHVSFSCVGHIAKHAGWHLSTCLQRNQAKNCLQS